MQIDGISRLKEAGIQDAEATYDELVSFISGISYSEARLIRLLKKDISPETEKKLEPFLSRRIAGEPLEYITGYRDFYGRRFLCAENVLIPRSDTEILVEQTLAVTGSGMRVLDLCTGTGCVGITISLEKDVETVLADISPYALACAEKNIEKLSAHRAKAVYHDVFSSDLNEKFDVIVSNPPYITDDEMKTLPEDVKHEPILALSGGADGLIFYRQIAEKYRQNLNDGGHILFECGYAQSAAVREILKKNGYRNIKTTTDYNGKERVVSATK